MEKVDVVDVFFWFCLATEGKGFSSKMCTELRSKYAEVKNELSGNRPSRSSEPSGLSYDHIPVRRDERQKREEMAGETLDTISVCAPNRNQQTL
jgi:hypothetical protein